MKTINSNIAAKFGIYLLLTLLPFYMAIEHSFASDQNKTPIYLSIVAILCIIYLGFYFLISKPINKIAKETKLVLTGGKYNRIKPSSPDEIGVLTHFFNEVTRNLEKISVDLVEQKRIFSELEIARKIQKDILPKKTKIIKGLDIVAKSKSAAEMGGDSFDFISNGKDLLFYIGDVTGHGVPAGLVMMMVNTLIHAFAKKMISPDKILIATNDILWHRIATQRFMTLIMMRWDSKNHKIYYTGAGHEHILIYRAKTKKVEMIKSGGIALKMIPKIDNIISEKELTLDSNDIILLYTDGITEAKKNQEEMFGTERLIQSLKKHGSKNDSEDIFEGITEDFSKYVGHNFRQEDDITMIIAKRLPEDSTHNKALKIEAKSHNYQNINHNQHWKW